MLPLREYGGPDMPSGWLGANWTLPLVSVSVPPEMVRSGDTVKRLLTRISAPSPRRKNSKPVALHVLPLLDTENLRKPNEISLANATESTSPESRRNPKPRNDVTALVFAGSKRRPR